VSQLSAGESERRSLHQQTTRPTNKHVSFDHVIDLPNALERRRLLWLNLRNDSFRAEVGLGTKVQQGFIKLEGMISKSLTCLTIP
jgi:hypothetical protein